MLGLIADALLHYIEPRTNRVDSMHRVRQSFYFVKHVAPHFFPPQIYTELKVVVLQGYFCFGKFSFNVSLVIIGTQSFEVLRHVHLTN